MAIIFETNRLQTRPLGPGDLPALHAMQSRETVMRYTSGKAQNYEESKAELERIIGAYEEPGNDFWVWAVVQKHNGVFAGTCALYRNEEAEWEIGYRFDEPCWGKGYATEVCTALIAYAGNLDCQPLVAYVYDAHVASARVLEKAGMVLEKRFLNEKMGCMDRKYIFSPATDPT